MKLPFYLGLLISVLILAITILISFDKTVPSEFIAVFASLTTYFIGIITENPSDKGN